MSSNSLPTSRSRTIADFLEFYRLNQKVHAKSLISTFFGDLVSPYGGTAWVETITTVLRPLGINSRLVRTSLFRLCEEGWLRNTRIGRKSHYQLTKSAQHKTSQAEKVIYYPRQEAWDRAWTLVFLLSSPTGTHGWRELEQEMTWLGFGAVANHVWAHPCIAEQAVAEKLTKFDLSGQVICMKCKNIQDIDLGFTVDDQQMALQYLQISDVEAKYQQFIETYSSIYDSNKPIINNCSPAELLSLRLLMMDDYRRIILCDPLLPKALLADGWLGDQAYDLCGKIYAEIAAGAKLHYGELVELAESEILGKSANKYSHRFAC